MENQSPMHEKLPAMDIHPFYSYSSDRHVLLGDNLWYLSPLLDMQYEVECLPSLDTIRWGLAAPLIISSLMIDVAEGRVTRIGVSLKLFLQCMLQFVSNSFNIASSARFVQECLHQRDQLQQG